MSGRDAAIANNRVQSNGAEVNLGNQSGAQADRTSEQRMHGAPSKFDYETNQKVRVTPASEIGDIVSNRNLSTEDRIKAFEQVRKDYALNDYQMRQLVGSAYNARTGMLLSGKHTPESMQALKKELDAVDKKYSGTFGFNEIQDYRRALEKKDKQVLDSAAADQRKMRQGVIKEGETHAAEIMLDQDMTPAEKMSKLEKIQKDLKLGDSDMREFLGRVVPERSAVLIGA